ncbi:thiamine-binding protein [Salinispira pacifica]|uniref:Thiamine-binding protein domain-containing protein n=1 Tax=Salinispira pacifica TaxID=1307761 RepID=V5WK12_9SPIO|nr:thiamine-binding protein [Salinispira pacifica]AHC16078.1 hypothetical protein L21SP2_2726 [Salinispira pacifica]
MEPHDSHAAAPSNEPDIHLSLQVLPRVDDERLYPVIDKVIAHIAASGFKYWVGPMETTIQGPLTSLLELVKEAQQICVKEGAERIVSYVKIDYKTRGVAYEEKMAKYS